MSNHIYSPDIARYELAAASKPIRKMFTEQVKYNGPDGCWEWQGMKSELGYGQMNTGRRGAAVAVHRLALFLAGRPVPPELVVDHLCRNPGCVNPKHLDIVTQRVNSLRGESFYAKNYRKTHCVHGHEFNESNTAPYKRNGVVIGRRCKECARIRGRRAYAKRKTS